MDLKDYLRNYRIKNKKALRIKRIAYKKKNKVMISETNKRWYINNKEEHAAKRKIRYQKLLPFKITKRLLISVCHNVKIKQSKFGGWHCTECFNIVKKALQFNIVLEKSTGLKRTHLKMVVLQ